MFIVERTQKIVDWLSPLSFSDRYNDILSRSCEGTGQWLIETVEASSWLSTGDKASLWCTGIRKRVTYSKLSPVMLIDSSGSWEDHDRGYHGRPHR